MSLLMAGLSMAIQALTKKDVNKAVLLVEGKGKLSVQFNPVSFRIERRVSYVKCRQKENEANHTTFAGVVAPVMYVSLFFDTSGGVAFNGMDTMMKGNVSELVDEFTAYTQIIPGLHRPPLVVFSWGTTLFPGFITEINTNYTMFDKDGIPLRARMDMVIEGYPEDGSGGAKIPLESPDRTKARVVSDSSSIWGLAGKEYDDVGRWREIAKANAIMDPFAIPSGTVLKVPALKDS